MEAASEAGADRAFGIKNLDAETSLPTSTESFSVGKTSQLSDHKPHGYVSNVLVDLPRVNKGGAIRGERTINNHHFCREGCTIFFLFILVFYARICNL